MTLKVPWSYKTPKLLDILSSFGIKFIWPGDMTDMTRDLSGYDPLLLYFLPHKIFGSFLTILFLTLKLAPNFCWLTNVDCWHFNLWRFYSILDSFSWIVIKWKFIFIWSLFSVILRTWTFPSLNSDRRIAALKKPLLHFMVIF